MTTGTATPVQATAPERPSLELYARLAGVLFVVLLVLGPISILLIPSQLVVDGDPAATASNITESEGLFRAVIVIDTVILLVEAAMSALLYALFHGVSRPLAMLTALARLAQAAVMGANLLLYFGVLLLVGGATGYLDAFGQGQREALALLFLDTHAYGVLVGQAFFGVSLLALGVLIRRADLVPRILGSLMIVGAVGYLADSFGVFISQDLEEPLSVLVGVTSLIGELPFFVWILVKGINHRAGNKTQGGR